MSTPHAVLDELVTRELAGGRTVGVAVVATDRERVLLETYRGWADVAERRPVDPDTVFQIGSITKVATAILAVQQHRAGRLDLRVPVRQYLPWLPERPYGAITAHQLLSHTAGLGAGSDASPPSPYMAFAEYGEPGEFRYSNTGFQVLGMIVEEVAGRPYPAMLAEDVLGPLGMAASVPAITGAIRATMATGYVESPDDLPFGAGDGLTAAPFFEYDVGDGCMACTARDLAAFARMLANGGAGVLDQAGFELLTTPVTDTGNGESICYGVFAKDSYGYPDLNHGGGMVGQQSMLCVDRETGIGVVAFVNGIGFPTALVRGVLRALRQERLGEPVTAPEPPPGPTLADYAGDYQGRTVRLVDGRLHLDGTALTWLEGDAFALPGSPYPVRFGRRDGAVVELAHGPDVWPADGHAAPVARPYPPEWDAYVGQYRAHKPFEPTFRILIRNGTPLLVWPSGREIELVPTAQPTTFRLDGRLEAISFDTPAGPRMLRAVLSGCPYFRPFR